VKGEKISDVDTTDSPPAAAMAKADALEVVLGRRAWRAPLLIGSVFVAFVATVRASSERGRAAGGPATRGLGAHSSAAWA
jgi:hypothetical protein